MKALHQIAQLLISSWVLAGDEGESETTIPTSHGILDRALQALAQEGVLPKWAADQLHFTDSRIGRQCVELPEILDWAQMADLTSVPNPYYQVADVQVEKATARKLLRRIPEINEETAVKIGQRLRNELTKAQAETRADSLA